MTANVKSGGIKIELVRPGSDVAPWLYEGVVTRGTATIAVSARVDADGTVEVSSKDPQAEGRVRLLLRACYKQSVSEGLAAPPRKIVRWREERV